jgi:ligand-binding SRPBCC domain-containing protein
VFKLDFVYETTFEESLEEVWGFFETAENLVQITSFPKVKLLSDPSTREGNLIKMELQFPLLTLEWDSFISEMRRHDYFVDEGARLPFPFRTWKHTHRFYRRENLTMMEDRVELTAHVPAWMVRAFLISMFRQREVLTKAALKASR